MYTPFLQADRTVRERSCLLSSKINPDSQLGDMFAVSVILHVEIHVHLRADASLFVGYTQGWGYLVTGQSVGTRHQKILPKRRRCRLISLQHRKDGTPRCPKTIALPRRERSISNALLLSTIAHSDSPLKPETVHVQCFFTSPIS